MPIGCSFLYGDAVDPLGQLYYAGIWSSCDYWATFAGGPASGWSSSNAIAGWAPPTAITVDAQGSIYVIGTNQSEGGSIIPAVNALPGCQVDTNVGPGHYFLLDLEYLMKIDMTCPRSSRTRSYDSFRPNTHCDVYVAFTPKASGTRAGMLTFADNAASSPQTVTLTGIGTTVSLSPTSLAFPTQLINAASLPKLLTLTNKGSTSLSFTSISTTGDFVISAKTCGISLGAGASCTVRVAFKPTAIGTRSGSLSISYNGGTPSKAKLSGIGTMVLLSPTSLTYVAQKVGTTSLAKAITVTNKSKSILTISSITKSGDFVIVSKTCGATLVAGASCKVNLAFKPTVKGTRTGSLSISHDGGASPAKVSLTGTGI